MSREKCKELIILNAATKMFNKKGFHLTVVDDIAQCAGIAKGTIYEYFNSKDTLFIKVIQYNYEHYLATLQEKIDLEQNFIGKIANFICYHEKAIESELKMSYVIFQNGDLSLKPETQNEIRRYLHDKRNKVQEIICTIFKLGQTEGKVKDINIRLAADMFYDMTIRYCMRAMQQEYSEQQKQTERNQLVDIFLFGICN